MIVGYPTEEELHSRINNQLSWRGSTETVALLWLGYLGALLEWGLIEPSVYSNLSALLPKIGQKEQYELFADEPISAEQERELDASCPNDQ
jgi:hypothetical protein